MKDQIKSIERDEVLFAFHEAYERPTADEIIEWVSRFPQFADDIRAHAAVAWDWATLSKESEQVVDETMSARAYSQALNIIYSAQPATESEETAKPCRTFQQIQAAIGKETYQIASELDISRAVLSDLFNGSMTPPIRKRLIDHLVSILNTTIDEFSYALDYAQRAPRIGHAKSQHTPTVIPRSCDDIIRDSNMSAARKRYWLEEE
jgi:transcriptional regulator with XRE-family HTH domain